MIDSQVFSYSFWLRALGLNGIKIKCPTSKGAIESYPGEKDLTPIDQRHQFGRGMAALDGSRINVVEMRSHTPTSQGAIERHLTKLGLIPISRWPQQVNTDGD